MIIKVIIDIVLAVVKVILSIILPGLPLVDIFEKLTVAISSILTICSQARKFRLFLIRRYFIHSSSDFNRYFNL